MAQFADDVPTVLFDSPLDLGRAFVGSDNFQSIPLIVDYLCRSGQPPCFLEMAHVNPNAETRRDAYIRAMERLGQEPYVIRVSGESWDFERIGFEEGTRLIEAHAFPTNTVLCSNDRLAIGVLSAACQKGLRVGRGEACAMRVAGHDDHPSAQFTFPPLTTVSQDYMAIVENAVRILFDIIQDPDAKTTRKERLFPGILKMRASA